jgi:hypothetical protein
MYYFRSIIFPAVITLVLLKICIDLIIVYSKFIIFGVIPPLVCCPFQ